MRFEKAKKFFSVSMVVCMFTLAFGMMTAYAYSYLMFGGGFGRGSYGSYTGITIQKKWDMTLGTKPESGVMVSYTPESSDGKNTVVLNEGNDWTESFRVRTDDKPLVYFSINENQAEEEGFTAIYQVEVNKTYALTYDDSKSGSRNKESESETESTGETVPESESAGEPKTGTTEESEPEASGEEESELQTGNTEESGSEAGNPEESSQEGENLEETLPDANEADPEGEDTTEA